MGIKILISIHIMLNFLEKSRLKLTVNLGLITAVSSAHETTSYNIYK